MYALTSLMYAFLKKDISEMFVLTRLICYWPYPIAVKSLIVV